ncbi:MAG TPA: serine/threonine protein kinase [Verrucomicrobiales bacterium]|nr:serine/threonine protein kinase [Verrucomicrobiales bacterium]HRJ09500.1 PQQ-binding-like beta-propeller repeat protein [Prosthecobacter sp.]HRK14434.1 PQQ-binding-like beta-propeller repeat protein [Prosthecobacter sp.]
MKSTLLSSLLALTCALHAADWPRFLGPNGAAVVKDADVPLTWSDSENIRWKFETPGPGSSSPIVSGGRVFLTCWSGYGDKEGAGDISKLKRHLLCLDLEKGVKLWEAVIPSMAGEDPWQGFITEHGYATHTPVTDGAHVFVFFGKTGAMAFDMEGNQVWHTPLGSGSGRNRWGSGGSPVLHGDMLIVNASDESRAFFALDKKTGKEIWKADGDAVGMAYGTPSLIESGGRTDLVVALAEEVWGMNPETGKLRWFAAHRLPGNVSPTIVHDATTAYLYGGYPTAGSVAVKLGGKGDVTQSHIVWSKSTSSYIPTPILHEGRLYVVNDAGFALCVDAATGEDIYRERVIDSGGGRGRGKPFYASPVLVGDRLYCVSRRGGTYVIAARPEYQKLAHNVLSLDDSQFHGTPAVLPDGLLLRSDKALYRIGK